MNIETIDIEPTTICDLSCPFCFGPKIRKKALDLDINIWKNALRNFKDLGINNVVVSGGEPLLRDDLYELMYFAQKELGLKTVLSTHGRFQEKVIQIGEVCNWIALPIDGFKPETINFMRTDNHSNEKIISLCKKLKNTYPQIQIKIGTVATQRNISEIPSIANFLNENKNCFDTWKIYQYMPRRKFKNKAKQLEISDSRFSILKEQISTIVDNSYRTYFSGISDRINAYLFVYHNGEINLVNVGKDFGDVTVGNIQEFSKLDIALINNINNKNHTTNFNNTY